MTEPGFRKMHEEKRRRRQHRLIPTKLIEATEATIKALLHASRDALRNRKRHTKGIRFDINDAYYGEAYGIMRALEIQGFGYLDGDMRNSPRQREQNLVRWFSRLENEVLEEEGYGPDGDGECAYCMKHHFKDDASYYAKLVELSEGGKPLFGHDGKFILRDKEVGEREEMCGECHERPRIRVGRSGIRLPKCFECFKNEVDSKVQEGRAMMQEEGE